MTRSKLPLVALAALGLAGCAQMMARRHSRPEGAPRTHLPHARSRAGNYYDAQADASFLKNRAGLTQTGYGDPTAADWIVDLIDRHETASLDELASIDKRWAARIGGQALRMVGDDVRNPDPTPSEVSVAQQLVDACPARGRQRIDSVADAFERASYDAKYAAFEQKLASALASSPRAVRAVTSKEDFLTALLDCEEAHRRIVASGVGVLPEGGPGPTSEAEYRQAVVTQLPPYLRAAGGPTGHTVGCGYVDVVVREAATVGGKFADAQLGGEANDLGNRPIPCAQIPRSAYGPFAREMTHALRVGNVLRPGDAAVVFKGHDWEYHRNPFGVVTERIFYARLFERRMNLTTYCGNGDPFASCEQGGAAVMALYNAAAQELGEARSDQSSGKRNACRTRAWEAFHLADGAKLFRQAMQQQGIWLSSMHYLPKAGGTLNEAQLFASVDRMHAGAQRLFSSCGGANPGQTDYHFWIDPLGGGFASSEGDSWFRTQKPSAAASP